MKPMDVLSDLDARGLIHDTTDREALATRFEAGPVRFYWGCDPTADSLHIGNLVGVLAVRRLQLAGHRPIVLAGGATGMIGDPSGRSEERNLLDDETLARNLAGIKAQLGAMISFDGPAAAVMVDNATWTADLTLLEFLRDVGKHVTVNQMVAKESVRSRLAGEEGISYTEFTYMLLQAHDYAWLHANESCELQVGGSDQWGNITAGIDLVRRRSGGHVHGLTWPLLVRSDGQKFGKSQAGNIWLGAERTSRYAFYQYWVQVPDDDVRRFLLQLTLLPVDECEAVADAHLGAPQERTGQRRLAREVTALVHGDEAAAAAEAASAVLFGGDPVEAPLGAFELLVEELDATSIDRGRLAEGIDIVSLFVESGLASSRGDARRNLAGAYVNGARVDGEEAVVTTAELLHDRWVLLRKGKRTYHLLVATA
ncbi:MAG TPA: tyrosine--tRNA ligase [Acidimicrobiales bacterium]|nr:tyrosine--tRNA ligase [Acidimicrobiales bacterium]